MNRRRFLSLLGLGTAGIALEHAIPLGRVWSFPKEIIIADPLCSLDRFYLRQAYHLYGGSAGGNKTATGAWMLYERARLYWRGDQWVTAPLPDVEAAS
jgi:hypothetical protein